MLRRGDQYLDGSLGAGAGGRSPLTAARVAPLPAAMAAAAGPQRLGAQLLAHGLQAPEPARPEPRPLRPRPLPSCQRSAAPPELSHDSHAGSAGAAS